MAVVLLCAVLFAGAEGVIASIPSWMHGRWTGMITTSELGPRVLAPGQDFLEVSSPAADGSVYMRHVTEEQLFRILGTEVVYCFSYDNPDAPVTGADVAPFELQTSDSNDQELNICWKGPRLPSHTANCTGCGCAHWTLRMDGTTLKSTFMQSPPVVHMSIDLHMTNSTPPSPEEIRKGWDCQFTNSTGSHIRTRPSAHGMSQRKTERVQIPGPDEKGNVRNCFVLAGGIVGPVYMEYVASTDLSGACMPCDVTFTLSIPTPTLTGQYVAIGFKGAYAAYYNSTLAPEIPNYWGMGNDDDHNISELSGRIFAGFLDKHGTSCVRQMRADAYVGSVIDVPPDGLVQYALASSYKGRTNLVFTTKIHLGKDVADMNWQNGSFGALRVMWATGPVEGDGSCKAAIGFHNGDRALASLNFPGYGFPVTCPADGSTSHVSESMLDTDYIIT